MKVRLRIFLCLLALVAVWCFWPRAGVVTPRTVKAVPAAPPVVAATKAAATNAPVAKVALKLSAAATNRWAFRLSNTSRKFANQAVPQDLVGNRHFILLENAIIDTTAKVDLNIPSKLKASDDPGAYIVQARGLIDPAFRAALGAAGATLVSYIPNNAELVQVSSAGAAWLAASPTVQAVLPYEPYFKIQSSLLGLAVDQKPLPAGTYLTLGIFSGAAQSTEDQLQQLGAQILSRDRTPFGSLVRVAPPLDWTALASLPGVQLIEPAYLKKPANDLTRVAIGENTDTVSGITNNYLGLTGTNVLVEVNDSGIDTNHPDFSVTGSDTSPGTVPPSRITSDIGTSLIDTLGHGTHVAGIIAGNGSMSITPTNVGAVIESFNEGSVSNADFRGKAPNAKLYSVGFLGVNDGNDPANSIGDSYLQEQPALTNALISNNSWENAGDYDYDLSAASYDAAVRDALPELTGPQPVLFVFAAGNSGGGDDDGSGGVADSITSPGTAKNVITVGALEAPRNITNLVTSLDGTTNAIWAGQTATAFDVAYYSSRGNVGIGTEGTYGRFKPDVVAPGTFIVSTRSTVWDQYAYYNVTNYYENLEDDTVVGTNFAFGFVDVPQNAIQLIIQVLPNSLSPNPFSTNLPVYVSAFGVPDPNNPATYDILKTNGYVAVPPDNGGLIGSISDIQGGGVIYAVGIPTNYPSQSFDVLEEIITTNDLGNQTEVLSNLNQTIGPWYRYESGTSMATPAVSGMLALMQDFFVNQRNPNLATNPSPALLKAMVVNGARLTSDYEYGLNGNVNYEGWGEVNLPDSLPAGLTNSSPTNGVPMFFIDQSPTNTVATGDRRTYNVSVTNALAFEQPLRVTLAWTDPPGNPAAAIKLVNDLELIVSNTATGNVYYGNNFSSFGTPPFSAPESATNTPVWDGINNVENVFLPGGLATNYTVTVYGRAVNANAVTLEQTNIVQDFALVISSGDNSSVGISVTPAAPTLAVVAPDVDYLQSTNGIYFDETAGSSSPWLSTNVIPYGTNLAYFAASGSLYATNAIFNVGQTNQWHFYVITNTQAATNSAYTNAAFIIFNPDTLSLPREGTLVDDDGNSTRPEAELSMLVASPQNFPLTGDPNAGGLTNLDVNTISNCLFGVTGDSASVGPGGTKFITYTNSQANQIYYIGVQCQDQTAAQYAFVPVFSAQPFSSLDKNGNEYLSAFNVPYNIPDGNNTHPGVSYVMALAVQPMEMRRVTVTNTITHQNFGDLIGGLSHDGKAAVLNNHDGFGNVTNLALIYDDSGTGDIPGSRTSDGPGTLNNFTAQEAAGLWMLNEVDDSPGNTGVVNNLQIRIEPHKAGNGVFITVTVPPMGWYYDYINVGVGYTNLLVVATNLAPTAVPPIQLYVQPDTQPTLASTNDVLLTNCAVGTYSSGVDPGNEISTGPPLNPDIYYIGLYNPTTQPMTVLLGTFLYFNSAAVSQLQYQSTDTPTTLLDDAVTDDYIFVDSTQTIQDLTVGIRVDHPRISDLVFTLIDPDGARYLLMENRGGQDTNGCGTTVLTTNLFSATADGSAQPNTNVINTGMTSGILPITYNFYTAKDEMTIYYGPTVNSSNLIYDTGVTNNPQIVGGGGGPQDTQPATIFVPYGPTNNLESTYVTIVMDQFLGTNRSDAWTYTAGSSQTNYYYLAFTSDTNLTTTPIKYAPTPFLPAYPTNITWTDSFEAYGQGVYTPSNSSTGTITNGFGGWTVLTNIVEISSNLPAYDGTNYLQLDNGAVSYLLPTLAGQQYLLTYEQGNKANQEGTNLPATNAEWTASTLSFIATSNGTPLVLDASGSGLAAAAGSIITTPFDTNTLFDAFTLQQLPQNLYYQPEQSLTPLNGTPANGTNGLGTWTLEILDNRAGATNPAPVLDSWALNFTFANTNFTIPTATIIPGQITTNYAPPNSLTWYEINVPTNAIISTNSLLFATLPLNLWFSTNVPPTITNAATGDTEFLAASTGGTFLLYTNITPSPTNLVPGGIYYLGVQNPNSTGAGYALDVTFDLVNVTNAFAPPFATTLPATAVTGTNAQLDGFATANGTNAVAWFQWGPTTSYGNLTPATLIGNATNTVTYFTAAITNLTFAEIYHARLVVTNALGIAYGADVQFAPGTPVSWGLDADLQTNVPAGLSNVVAVAGGLNHSLALLNNGTVVAWGDDTYGQTNVPVNLTNVVSIAAGGDNSLALLANGTVVEWGDSLPADQTIVPPAVTNAVAIAAGWSNSVALLSNGTLVTWGNNTYGQLTIPASLVLSSNVVGVAAGGNDVMALVNNGTVVAWGNSTSQLGVPGTLTNVVTIADGSFHSLALSNNQVVAWGDNTSGESTVPPGVTNAVAIAAGFDDSIALLNNGTVTAWGDNTYGKTNVPAGLTAFAIAAGANHVLALTPQPPVYPPYAYTEPASGVTGTNGQLNGFATANGYVSTAWFQWGLTTGYGNITPAVVLGNTANTVTYCTAAITNLLYAQIYHARLVVSNAVGIAYGADQQFAPGMPVSWGLNVDGQATIPPGLSNVVAVAGGFNHSLALLTNGTVLGWGDNSAGQIVPQSFSTNAVSIAAGGNDSLALLADGSVREWGDNSAQQLNVPPNATNVVAIAAGSSNSVALLSNGTLVLWGDNTFGETNIPASLILSSNVVGVAAGSNDVMALLNNGTVVSWGNNAASQTNVPGALANVVAVADGSLHSLALLNNGNVLGWGDNAFGEITVPAGVSNAVAIAAGSDDSIALLNNGTVTAWGDGSLGQTNVPAGLTAFAIAAGASHMLALAPQPPVNPPYANTEPASGVTGTNAQLNGFATANGYVSIAWFNWGTSSTNYPNQTTPVTVGAGYNVVYVTNAITNLIFGLAYHYQLVVSNSIGITYGYDHLLVAGSTVGWGDDSVGQIDPPAGISNVVAIAAGGNHSLEITNGAVLAWGDNFNGESTVPSNLSSNVIAIAGGYTHSLAVQTTNGLVTAWGDNTYGEATVPDNVSNIVAVAGGDNTSMALDTNGLVYAWGENTNGGLTNLPAGLSNVVQVAVGGEHALALLNNGTVVGWGTNSAGQLSIPPGLANVVAVSAGAYHSLALLNNGTVVAWGYDADGETNVPANATNVEAIAAGGYHSLALLNNGNVVAWGLDSSLQTNVPVTVSNAVAVAAGEFHSLALTSPYNINLNLTNYPVNPTNPVPVTNVVSAGGLLWFQIDVPTNAIAATNTLVFSTGPVNLWWSTNQPPSTNTPVDEVLLSGQTSGTAILYATNPVPPFIAPGGVYYLGVQNPGSLSVTDAVQVTFELAQPGNELTNGVPSTNTVGANSIDWFQVQVPATALAATNALLFAVPDVNLWFSTNVPPTTTNPATGDFELQTNSSGGTNIITPGPVLPALVPGGIYYLGVENTNNVPATFALLVTFELPTTNICIASIINTNMGGTNGYLLTWFTSTNYQFHLQWRPSLTTGMWTEMKGVISDLVPNAGTNALFQYFDNGDTNRNSAPLGPMRFYRLHLLNSPTNTPPEFFGTPPDAFVSSLTVFTVTNAARDWDIPAQNLTYVLYNSLGDTNALINPNGIITWPVPAATNGLTNVFTTVVSDNGVPVKSSINTFTVFVNVTPAFGSVMVVSNGVSLTWPGLTNQQFEIQWTTNLAPPVNWTVFPPPPITSTNGVFNFVDTNSAQLMKFYQLILLP